jgi:hypothetical protein
MAEAQKKRWACLEGKKGHQILAMGISQDPASLLANSMHSSEIRSQLRMNLGSPKANCGHVGLVVQLPWPYTQEQLQNTNRLLSRDALTRIALLRIGWIIKQRCQFDAAVAKLWEVSARWITRIQVRRGIVWRK